MKQINLVISICLLAGCQPSPAQKPVWEQVQFKELAAAKHSSTASSIPESPLQFTVCIFSVAAVNFAEIKDIWTSLSTRSIGFTNVDLFRENGFVAGAGQASMWQPVAEKLRAMESKQQKMVNLIMLDNSTDRVLLGQIDGERNIFYTAQPNQVSGVTLGPGEAMLRLTASIVPDMRGVCRLTIEPTFNNTAKAASVLTAPDELVFNAVAFTAKMSPGDFILLGPSGRVSGNLTPSGIFFAAADESSVQLYLIVCTGVNN